LRISVVETSAPSVVEVLPAKNVGVRIFRSLQAVPEALVAVTVVSISEEDHQQQ
jgi:hypothetical protein